MALETRNGTKWVEVILIWFISVVLAALVAWSQLKSVDDRQERDKKELEGKIERVDGENDKARGDLQARVRANELDIAAIKARSKDCR